MPDAPPRPPLSSTPRWRSGAVPRSRTWRTCLPCGRSPRGWTSCGSRRSSDGSAPTSTAVARPRRRPSSSRSSPQHPLRERLRGASDARALPQRAPGRRARGVPRRARDARRRARARAERRAAGAGARDPAPGPDACAAAATPRRPAPRPCSRPRCDARRAARRSARSAGRSRGTGRASSCSPPRSLQPTQLAPVTAQLRELVRGARRERGVTLAPAPSPRSPRESTWRGSRPSRTPTCCWSTRPRACSRTPA